MRAPAGQDTGAIAVVVALFAVVAFGFAAIVVDLGYARMVKGQAQDAADSAALAAAAALFEGGSASFGTAVSAAQFNVQEILGIEPAEWTGCEDPARLAEPAPGVPCISFDAAEGDNPRQVRVRVPQTPETTGYAFFGGVFGYSGMTISAAAVASLGPVEFTPECAICVLGAGPHVLTDAEVRTATATGEPSADISFNGDVALEGLSEVTAVGRTVFLSGTTDSSDGFGDALITDADPIEDPLEGRPNPPDADPLLPPVPPALPPPLPRVDPCNLDKQIGGSGVYDAVELVGTCFLDEGTYVVTGELTAEPGARITGDDVQIWLQGGSIDLSDASVVDLNAPSDEFLVFAPSGSPAINIFGAVDNSISGHIYAPGGSLSGGGSCALSSVRGLIVASRLDIAANQCLESTAPTNRVTTATNPPVLIR